MSKKQEYREEVKIAMEEIEEERKLEINTKIEKNEKKLKQVMREK